jgi:hypothetical protein
MADGSTMLFENSSAPTRLGDLLGRTHLPIKVGKVSQIVLHRPVRRIPAEEECIPSRPCIDIVQE